MRGAHGSRARENHATKYKEKGRPGRLMSTPHAGSHPPSPNPHHLDAVSQGRRIQIHQPETTLLVVIIPALNEAATIADVVRRVPRNIQGVDQVAIVVIDDGSTDRTAELARAQGADVVRHASPSGVGAAFHSGLRKAVSMGADLVVSLDGDGQFAPEDIPKLVGPILSGDADFITGSRFIDPKLQPEMPMLKIWGNRQVSRLISHLTGKRYYDVSCGMRAYSRDATFSLSLLEPFTYTHEVFLHLAAKRLNIVEMPIRVRGVRQYGKSRVASNLIRYAFQTLKIVVRFYRDYNPLRFFGSISLLFLGGGIPLLVLCLVHYVNTGSFSPHKWAGFIGASLCAAAVVSLVMGVLGDMLCRQRAYLEEILYHARSLVANDSRRK